MFKVFYEISKQSYCLKRPLSRFNAWFRRIPHASMQLSPCATTAEATCCNYWSPRTLEPVFHNKRSPRRATKSSPHSPQLERAQTQQQSPSAAKSILIINNNFFKRPQPPTHNQEWLFVNITTKINFKCLFKCWNINSSLSGWVIWHCHCSDQIQWSMHSEDGHQWYIRGLSGKVHWGQEPALTC